MRILLIEDTLSLGSALKSLLEEREFVVDWTKNADESLAAMQISTFDAVLLDLGLPDRDGLDLLKGWRLAGLATPVIVISARTQVSDRISLLNAGADDFLVKPFEPDELVARIHALLRRPAALAEPELRFAGLIMKTDDNQVLAGDAPLELTPRERAVLKALLTDPQRVVSKEALVERLYSLDSNVQPKSIEVYVSRLRAKLSPHGVGVKTVRGLGYHLMALESA